MNDAKTAASLVRSEGWSEEAERLREREDTTLKAAGFEPEGAELWAKAGVCYGREAALQSARRG